VGTQVLNPLRACVKVADYCDSSSISTLTCVKMIEMCVESTFTTVSERFTIADCLFFVLVRTIRSSCFASSDLIKEA
jgi:hypothetical protein